MKIPIKLTEKDLTNLVKRILKEQKEFKSKKIMTLPIAWNLYLDAHFQYILDNVIKEPYDRSNLRTYFKVMSKYMKSTILDDMENVYDNYELGFDLKDIDSSFKQFKNAVQTWEYTRDDEDSSFDEEQDFLRSWGGEMGMFDDDEIR